MMIVMGQTVAVFGTEPQKQHVRFLHMVQFLTEEFNKAGRPLSGGTW